MQEEPLQLCEARLGWVVSCCRRGASHRHSETPCQDAHAVWQGSASGSPYIALAVADGHGDIRHDLSQFGAALAVNAALSEMHSIVANFGSTVNQSVLKSTFESDFPRRVVRRWRDSVLEDASSRLDGVAQSSDEEKQVVWTRYGTTLLAALVTSNAIMTAQLGDGHVLFVRSDGSIDQPMEIDADLLGSSTHSLCSTKAHLRWQTHFFDRGGGGLLLLTSDGLPDSFEASAKGEFHKFVHSLLDTIKKWGISKVAESLPKWLDQYSDQGSGDDMTIVVASIRGERDTPIQE